MQFLHRVECPACGSSDNKQMLSYAISSPPISDHLARYYKGVVPIDQFEGASYTLKLCSACRFIWQAEILDDDGMEQLYEKWINADVSRVKKQQEDMSARTGHSRQCLQVFKAVGGKVHEIRVLDFGAGWGNWLLMARAFGFRADALEISPSRRKQLAALGIDVVEPDAIQAGTYSFINAEQVVEHVPDPAGMIRQCHQWLKAGGVLRINVPEGGAAQQRIASGRWSPEDMATRPLEHINVFTPDSLKRLASANGFRAFQPPVVLPMTGLRPGDLRRFVGSLGAQILGKGGLLPRTLIWLRKV